MSCLHLLSKSPASGLLELASKALVPGDALLLLEDGVYFQSQPQQLAALPAGVTIHFLEQDLLARGLHGALPENAGRIDYDGLVELCIRHDKTTSWF